MFEYSKENDILVLYCFWLGVFSLCVWFIFLCGFVVFFCSPFFYVYVWFGDHGGGVTPGLVSIPEVKSSCVFDCTAGVPVGSLQRCRPFIIINLSLFVNIQ